MSHSGLPLGLSPALGFWNRHCAAMDQIYGFYGEDGGQEEIEDDTPQSLIDLWNDETRQKQLLEVFGEAERDRTRLLEAAYEVLVAAFNGRDFPLVLKPRRSRNPWAKDTYAYPRGKNRKKLELWVTIYLDSETVKEYVLVTSIWARGGKRATGIFNEYLKDTIRPPQAIMDAWSSGSAFLSYIPLKDFVDGDDVDLDAILQRLRDDLSRQRVANYANAVDALLRDSY